MVEQRSLLPNKNIQQEFGLHTTPGDLWAALQIHLYGLKLIADGRSFPEETDCAAWVLGKDNTGHFFTFGDKGKFSSNYIYGALVIYGCYYDEPFGDVEKTVVLSHQEALARINNGQDKYVYYEPKHIGITGPDKMVISKWGRGGGIGHVITHSPHVVPFLYGEPDYVYISTEVKNRSGKMQEIYIMPKYDHHSKNDSNLELILTNGKIKVGSIRGILSGPMGEKRSKFIVTEIENLTTAASVGNEDAMPYLISTVLRFLYQNAPAIANAVMLSQNIVEVGEQVKYRLRNFFQVNPKNLSFIRHELQ